MQFHFVRKFQFWSLTRTLPMLGLELATPETWLKAKCQPISSFSSDKALKTELIYLDMVV